MLVRLDNLQPWNPRDALNGLRHPPNIAQLWTAEELKAVGLVESTPVPIPEGKIKVGETRYVRGAGDTILEEYTLEDAPPPPVPAAISDRQFFQVLSQSGKITKVEALAAVKTGEIPRNVAKVLDNLSAEAKFSAEMMLSGATSFRRDHPLITQLAETLGLTSAQVDDLFRTAAAL